MATKTVCSECHEPGHTDSYGRKTGPCLKKRTADPEARLKRRITARKYQGDDRYSWAVFIDGRPMVTGIGQSQVPYYKRQALDILIKRATAIRLYGTLPPEAAARFTNEELKAFQGAFLDTWNTIAFDAGFVKTNAEAYELITDADRPTSIGKLDQALYERFIQMPRRAADQMVKALLGDLL